MVDRFQYGFDRNSNRRWKQQLAAPDGGQDEYYGYDGLQQVRSFQRGNVNRNRTAIAAVPVLGEGFEYDPTGNWERYQTSTNGVTVLDQTRTHNKDNQLVEIDGSAAGISYDLAGNATLLPPTENGEWGDSYQLLWDAWQRLVAIKSEDGTTTIATYGYDGQTRRLLRTVGGVASQCLYNKEWKALLEWDVADASATRKAYFWGAMHRDELVLRDRELSGSLDERLYVTHDYYHPTAIADAAGVVQERYAYSAFGVRRIMDATFATISDTAFEWEFAFQGQFRDEESGLYNYGYRYHTPQLGRWLNRDPLQELGGSNLYAMAMNQPINAVDKLGLYLNVTGKTTWRGCSVKEGGCYYIITARDIKPLGSMPLSQINDLNQQFPLTRRFANYGGLAGNALIHGYDARLPEVTQSTFTGGITATGSTQQALPAAWHFCWIQYVEHTGSNPTPKHLDVKATTDCPVVYSPFYCGCKHREKLIDAPDLEKPNAGEAPRTFEGESWLVAIDSSTSFPLEVRIFGGFSWAFTVERTDSSKEAKNYDPCK